MTPIGTLEQLGQVVRAARKQAGLSQAELARDAAVNRYTVIRLETGKLADVNYKTLASILGVLNLQLAVLDRPISGLPVLGEERR
jgi:transcriptional regulator with XRE-family HTH domain